MWRRERAIRGPERPTVVDIDPLNKIFSHAFTDRYRRDGMPGVRVPHLNDQVWRFALESAAALRVATASSPAPAWAACKWPKWPSIRKPAKCA